MDDVVEQVPVSRRLLEQEFRKETSTSIYEYISRLRMNKLAQLLLTVDEPIEALAMRIGLNDSKNLSRQFKTYKGMTPIEYKKRYKIWKQLDYYFQYGCCVLVWSSSQHRAQPIIR